MIPKSIYESKTWWGLLVVVLAYLAPLFGFDINFSSLADGATLSEVLQIAGAVLAAWGLRTASRPVKTVTGKDRSDPDPAPTANLSRSSMRLICLLLLLLPGMAAALLLPDPAAAQSPPAKVQAFLDNAWVCESTTGTETGLGQRCYDPSAPGDSLWAFAFTDTTRTDALEAHVAGQVWIVGYGNPIERVPDGVLALPDSIWVERWMSTLAWLERYNNIQAIKRVLFP